MSKKGTMEILTDDNVGLTSLLFDKGSSNPLVNIANQYVADGYTPVAWTFSTMPSEEWKNGVGSALTTYAADQTDDNWAAVVSAFVDGWAKEAAASK